MPSVKKIGPAVITQQALLNDRIIEFFNLPCYVRWRIRISAVASAALASLNANIAA
jgi:hypothetical protein